MTHSQIQILKRNLEVNGHERQIDKCIEEMGELIVELKKYKYDDSDNKKVRLEMADVYITLKQLEMFFFDCGKEIDFKINRLKERLNKKP